MHMKVQAIKGCIVLVIIMIFKKCVKIHLPNLKLHLHFVFSLNSIKITETTLDKRLFNTRLIQKVNHNRR